MESAREGGRAAAPGGSENGEGKTWAWAGGPSHGEDDSQGGDASLQQGGSSWSQAAAPALAARRIVKAKRSSTMKPSKEKEQKRGSVANARMCGQLPSGREDNRWTAYPPASAPTNSA